jgi:FkbM family methyltransferase
VEIDVSLLLRLAGRLPTNWIRAFTNARGRNPWVKRTTDWIPNRLRSREGVIQRGVARGLRFNGGNSATGFLLGTHDPNIQRALGLLIQPGQVVYDIGANVGFTALISGHLTGPKGRVICFEPQPKCDGMIQHNADINGFSHIQVRNEALGGEDGSARFMVTDNPTFSRMAGLGKPDATARHVDVSVRRLDAIIAQESLPKPDVMKIDIEGAEGPMLEGARQHPERALERAHHRRSPRSFRSRRCSRAAHTD